MRISVYIHVPFCRYKCVYCDFISYPILDTNLYERYVQELIREIRWWRRVLPDYKLYTVYIGGGTPSVLPRKLLSLIAKEINRWGVPEEFTIEANPEDITSEWIDFILDLGITRISIGVQTFNDNLLMAWNRHHTSTETQLALEIVREKGVNFNVDLIYPIYLPESIEYNFEYDVEKAISFNPPHVSLYIMDIYPGTIADVFVKKRQWSDKMTDNLYSNMQWLYDFMGVHNYVHYEISNFALEGFESKHNMVYWRQEFYLGVGISAWGFVNFVRYRNLPTIREYISGNVVREFYRVSRNDLLSEYGIMALRLINEGINRRRWEMLGGNWEHLKRRASSIKCLFVSDRNIFLLNSPKCVLFSNTVIEELFEPWL